MTTIYRSHRWRWIIKNGIQFNFCVRVCVVVPQLEMDLMTFRMKGNKMKTKLSFHYYYWYSFRTIYFIGLNLIRWVKVSFLIFSEIHFFFLLVVIYRHKAIQSEWVCEIDLYNYDSERNRYLCVCVCYLWVGTRPVILIPYSVYCSMHSFRLLIKNTHLYKRNESKHIMHWNDKVLTQPMSIKSA